ncbi:DNA recombination protein RmuC [Pelagibacteraceae bacterium]|nr:DNA recombination protein RmuC [Pelagibacteraceae bacterium]MDC0937377.1 DNA recombination protein RmuC [Pelagibacteraceae bacterium]
MTNLILFIALLILIILTALNLFFLLKKNKDSTQENNSLELEKLKLDINTSISTVSSSLNQGFTNLSKDVTKDMTEALTKVDEKVGSFNKQVEGLSKSSENFTRILSGVKQYGVLAEFSLASLLKDLLPAAQFIENVKMKPEETSDTVEFAIKLQDVLVPVDSHWPIEKYKAIDDAFQNNDKEALAEARKDLAVAFRNKAKAVSEKYISPPKTTDFAIVYAPTEGLFAELSSYRDPKTKELLLQELRTKHKITVAGPNTLSALLQSYHLGFQSLQVKKNATQIYGDLRTITTRFEKHFLGIAELRKKLDQAMKATDGFGRDARSIMRTLENIKNPSDDDDDDDPKPPKTPLSSYGQVEESIEEKIEKVN